MRSRQCSSTYIALLVLVTPMIALADLNGTATVSSGGHFSFDTGTTVTTGGDMAFSSGGIAWQGSATGYDLPDGALEYSTFTLAIIQAGFAGMLSSAPISNVAVNDLLIIHTVGGNYAKAEVTAVSNGSITFQYDTFGVAGNGPSITDVLDAGNYTETIAQGSVFVVKGTKMSASGFVQASFPLQTTMNGVSISFAPLLGGSATNAYIVYLYNQNGVNQLAAILPSTVAAGSYNVTVTNNGAASSPFAVQVVAQKPGLITQDSTGNGLAVVQNYVSSSELDVNRFTTGSVNGSAISPAHPGQTLIGWLVGMGSAPGGDSTASPGYDFTQHGVKVQVMVGGVAITPFYAGRAPGLAGTDQIDFTLPSNIPTGCTVPLQIVEGSVMSQTTFIAIAPSGSANACVQPGYTTSQLQQFDNGAVVYQAGGFSLFQETAAASGQTFTLGSAGGGFVRYTGFELAAIPASATSSTSPPTGCTVVQIPQPVTNVFVGGSGVFLDAGKVTLNGPTASGITNAVLTELDNSYSLEFAGFGATINGKLTAGSYTINGAGGADVGAFNASLNVPNPLTVTGGLPSTVNRSSGLTISWTGGNSSDAVVVTGEATNAVNNVQTGAAFVCYTTAGAGSLNVSSSILNQLPAAAPESTANQNSLTSLGVSWYTGATSGNGLFSAPLTAGGSISGSFSVSAITADAPTYQ